MCEKRFRSVYFLGIGGIGMSALARYFLKQGAHVAGYDKTPTAFTRTLISEGMEIHFTEDPSLIPAVVDLVIWTPAVPTDHAGYRYFLEKGFPVKKRAEILGEIASPFTTIAVAGTHGKTTTTTMIAHIFHSAGKPMLAFLGGIAKNFGTNFIELAPGIKQSLGTPTHHSTTAPHHHITTCIVEADEFDRSFLHLSPDIAIITSMDADHLDIYNNKYQLEQSFGDFAGRIRTGGSLIIKKGVGPGREIPKSVSLLTYSLKGESGFSARNIAIRNGLFHFDFITPDEILTGFELGMPGLFNLENAIAALAAGWLCGIKEVELKHAMRHFKGVVRRFDIRIQRDDFVYIDDYAHHPEELHACIHAVRELFPGKRITGVFQPHLYSRTRDLADDFARVLGELDSLILLDIYPAREQPIEGVHSQMLLDKTDLPDKLLCGDQDLIAILDERRPDVLLTLGAGDIDQLVQPITDHFEKQGRNGRPAIIHEKQGPER